MDNPGNCMYNLVSWNYGYELMFVIDLKKENPAAVLSGRI